jgi:hypothetical protein
MKKLTALFAFAFFLVFVGWAITPVQADPPRPAHKHGDGGVEGVTYCAELFSNDAEATGNGAFEWLGCVPVIPNEKENELRFHIVDPFVSPQGLDRGSKDSRNDWYNVFNDCAVQNDPIDVHDHIVPFSFQVGTVVVSAERLAVFFVGIVYGDPEVDVVVRLRGTHADFQGPMLPAPGGTSEFRLSEAWLDGHTTAQGRRRHCNRDGHEADLDDPGSTLRITATAAPPSP